MRFPPPEVIAAWPEPNYVDPERRGHVNTIVQVILVTIVTAFVAIRIYARLIITRARIGLDDIIIVISWIFAVGLTAGVVLALQKYGWDLHIWDLPPNDNVSSRKISWVCMILYAMSTGLTKASILIFYLRILVAKFDKLVTKITLGAVVAFFFAIILVLFLQCKPFGYYWEILIPGAKGTCINESIHVVASGAVNILFDVIIFVIPLRSLVTLKIRTSQKLQVLSLFSAGLLVIIAACVRVYYITVVYLDTYDVTWFGYQAWLFAALEVHVSIICACVPSCRAFFVSWNRSTSQGSRSATYPSGAARSYVNVDEDAMRLTRNSDKVGTRADVTAGSVKSEGSGEFSGDDAKMGVRVRMEVLQYQEDYVQGHQERSRRGRVGMA